MAKELAERVGARIKQRREDLGLTQQQVSDRMTNKAVTNQHVSNWERGVYLPSDENQIDLARALEVEVAFFYVDEPEPGTPDLMASLAPSNGNGATDPAGRIVSLLERQNDLLETVAEGLGDLMRVVLETAEEHRPTAKPSGRRKAADS